MTLSDFRRLARREEIGARIISDGCRDYVVEIRRGQAAGVLTDRKGRRKRFASLSEAKRAVKRAQTIHFAIRVAADEACAGQSASDSGFATLQLSAANAA
ncbi:MAG: hypothetical protein AAF541_10335 [Pseudomonadota bacterium]